LLAPGDANQLLRAPTRAECRVLWIAADEDEVAWIFFFFAASISGTLKYEYTKEERKEPLH
jgi:hypothetical protein